MLIKITKTVQIKKKIKKEEKREEKKSSPTWTSASPRLRDVPEAEARSPSPGLEWSGFRRCAGSGPGKEKEVTAGGGGGKAALSHSTEASLK